jgi:hypothetical protein
MTLVKEKIARRGKGQTVLWMNLSQCREIVHELTALWIVKMGIDFLGHLPIPEMKMMTC